jgi:hypothetical protein
MNGLDLLQIIARYVRAEVARTATTARPNRLATVDPGHTSGQPRVTFDGEDSMSQKAYPYLASYTPAAGDRVLMVPAGTSYVILGKVL